MDLTSLLSATLTVLLLLTLVIQCSYLVLALVQTLAAGAPLLFNRAYHRHPLQETAMQANHGWVTLDAAVNFRAPLQETGPPLSQEDAVLQAVQEANGVRLDVRVVQESLYQRNLPTGFLVKLDFCILTKLI